CPATDQRGIARSKGPACDIGAVERSVPIATTGGASAITTSSAHVAGTANPRQLPTTYRIRFGKTPAYGSQTAPVSIGSGSSNVTAGANLAGLDPNTTYHYRLIATNTDGTTLGADRTFTTHQLPFAGVQILTKRARVKKRRAKIQPR